jgi:hypothetical protein
MPLTPASSDAALSTRLRARGDSVRTFPFAAKKTFGCLAHRVLGTGDHVIVGLENALPLLLQNRLDLTSLLSQFEERR